MAYQSYENERHLGAFFRLYENTYFHEKLSHAISSDGTGYQ